MSCFLDSKLNGCKVHTRKYGNFQRRSLNLTGKQLNLEKLVNCSSNVEGYVHLRF